MKSFNEWMKERHKMEENIADYTPGFIRKPLQSIGAMGLSTQQMIDKKNAEEAEEEEMRKEREAKKSAYERNRLLALDAEKKRQDQRKAQEEAERERKQMEKLNLRYKDPTRYRQDGTESGNTPY